MSEEVPLTLADAFAEACAQVLDFLKREVPLDTWAVTRCDGEEQVCLFVCRDSLSLAAGDTWRSEGSCCQLAPGVASCVDVPIVRPSGERFGLLCGLDPSPPTALSPHQKPVLRLVASLLGTILNEDMVRGDVARRLQRAEMLADTDELTGLCNRRGWQRYVDHEDGRLRRYGGPAGMIAIDLDHLKDTNDRDGHPAGDRLLARAAEIIRRTIRSSDVAARLGGDEFGIIATHSSGPDVAVLADRLRAALAAGGVRASVGSAGYSITAGLAGTWTAADAAMYAEKRLRQHRLTG